MVNVRSVEHVYFYLIVKYPRDNLSLKEISKAYFFTRHNNSQLLNNKVLFFFENSLPLVRQEGNYLLFLFPLTPYREDVKERDISLFYSLWVSRLEEKLSTLPYSQFVYFYGLDPEYIQTLDEISSILVD